MSSIDLGIADSLERDTAFRERYLRRWAANEIAAELRAMRRRRRLRQVELAAKTATGQSAISRIEKEDYDGWTFKTLLTIALALDARLSIRLEPIEDVISRMRSHEEQDSMPILGEAGGTADLADVGNHPPPAVDPIDLLRDNGTAETTRTQVM